MAAALPFLTRDVGMVVTDALKDISGPLLGAIITILGEGRKSLYPCSLAHMSTPSAG